MFGKKRCMNCKEKVGGDFNFCPYCRSSLSDASSQEDWGMIGKNDFVSADEVRMPLGFNMIFNNLIKNLNKQFLDMDKEMKNKEKGLGKQPKNSVKKSGVSISISTASGRPPEIQVKRFGDMEPKKISKANKVLRQPKGFSDRQGKRFSQLPKKEPQTTLKRLSDSVIYEVRIPGVKSLEDISINQLESSIEIKAITKNHAYSKLIPISLPIRNYGLSNGTLVLELDTDN